MYSLAKISKYLHYKLFEEPKYKDFRKLTYNKLVSVGKYTYGTGPDNFIFFGDDDTKVVSWFNGNWTFWLIE